MISGSSRLYGMRVSDAALKRNGTPPSSVYRKERIGKFPTSTSRKSVANVMLDCLHCFNSLLSQRHIYINAVAQGGVPRRG